MAPGSFAQDQFGGGIFRGRRAPADSVYDAVNALLNDERELFRRGGSAWKSDSDATASLLGLWDGLTLAGQRTVFWNASRLYVLDSNDSSLVIVGGSSSYTPVPFSRAVVFGGAVLFRFAGGARVVYGGSRKTANYAVPGTTSITKGSTTLTAATAAFLANVDVGMVGILPGVGEGGLIAEVLSNTQVRLSRASTATASGSMTFQPASGVSVTPASTTGVMAVVGQRLVHGRDNRAYFSGRLSDPAVPLPLFDGLFADYHELPQAVYITGAVSIDDTAVLFTTEGVWAISNMALDLLDDVGNVQHQVAQINPDLTLWGDPGIAKYKGAFIVPAIDDVYLFTLTDAPIPVSQGVRPLYREYVEAGYQPGTAAIYRGHYFLPVADASNNLVDVLVCRLDLADPMGARRPGWTRLANGAAGRAYATRVGATGPTPKLLGLDGVRVSHLTGIFDPDSTRKQDADGTAHAFTVISNDVKTGPGGRPNTALSALVTAELVDAASDNPTYTFATAAGAEGSSFTAHTAPAVGSTSAPESDGTSPTRFDIVRKVDRIRWRFQTAGAAASAILRRVELRIRQSGRQ